MNKTREFSLPFGIEHRVKDGIASIESDLPEPLSSFSDPIENGRIVGVVEGVEQLLLSLARVGIDLSNSPISLIEDWLRSCFRVRPMGDGRRARFGGRQAAA